MQTTVCMAAVDLCGSKVADHGRTPMLTVPQLFEAYRMVYDFGRTWSYEEYSSKPKSLREIRRDMHKQREWRNELDRMKIFNVRAVRNTKSASPRMCLVH